MFVRTEAYRIVIAIMDARKRNSSRDRFVRKFAVGEFERGRGRFQPCDGLIAEMHVAAARSADWTIRFALGCDSHVAVQYGRTRG